MYFSGDRVGFQAWPQTVGVATDWHRQIRRTLATGDAAGAVAALAAADAVGSQLAGDALLLALSSGAAGAAPMAQRCAAALRARGWEGDEELASQLDAARRTTAAEPTREIPVDLDMLADVLEGGLDAAGGRLDLNTGQAWPETVLSDAWAEDEDHLDDDDRWLSVEPLGSRPAYRDMIDFIATRSDPRLSARLEVAIDGRGAFGRFKRILDDWPQDRLEWIEFSEERRRGRARAWLISQGYQPAARRNPSSTDQT